MAPMRVQLVDPSAYTPPYDHSLAGGLARAGADVELVTSRYPWDEAPSANGFRVTEAFYRLAMRRDLPQPARRVLKLAEHVPDMLAYRRRAREADVCHYQWLPLEALDSLLLPRGRPRVFTLHNVRRRGDGRAKAAVTRRLAGQMDALVVHSRDAAEQLRERFGADAERVHHIPHGALDYLTRLPSREVPATEGPVVLWFGTVRHYKGVDTLLEAFREVQGAELWIVGKPEIPMGPLHELARRVESRVRFVERFVPDPELASYIRRADVVALPYRRVDQSGVLYSALAFSKPIVMTAVGGFPEVAEEHGAARLVPPEDPGALAGAIGELLSDEQKRTQLSDAASQAAAGPYSWDRIGRRTLDLYESLL
jgi:glycosyltransferase involved in cell wall biosynthesis